MGRVKNIDAARGMLMVYVVFLIHGLFWLNLTPQLASSWLLFEMPMISLISGYSFFFVRKLDKKSGGWQN